MNPTPFSTPISSACRLHGAPVAHHAGGYTPFEVQGGLRNEIGCIKAFSETDFTEDLKKFDVPTLIIHGDDDQIVPIGASAHPSAKLVRNATLKIYPGGSHGLADTSKDQLSADLLAFLETMSPLRRTPRTWDAATGERVALTSPHWRHHHERSEDKRSISARPPAAALRG